MNKQNNSNQECIKLNGERTPVSQDDVTIKDDINDYFFIKTRKKKYKKVHTDKSTEDFSEDFPYIRSTHSHHRKKKRRKMKTWKKVLIGVTSGLLALIILLVGSFFALVYKGRKEMHYDDHNITAPAGVTVEDGGQYVVHNGSKYELNKNITSVLFMGVDKRNIDEITVNGTGGQADFLVLITIDIETGKVNLINISRETMVDVAEYSAGGSYVGMNEQQLCLAYAYGDGMKTSCENTVNSVQRLFYNIPIKSYYSLDLEGIATVNDAIGGVDVVSPETIAGFVAGESYHLEGTQAEDFIRKRNTEVLESNMQRMERQKIYVTSYINKAVNLTKHDFSVPLNVFNAASSYSCTNLNVSKVCYLAEEMITDNGGVSTEFYNVPGEVVMGEKYAEYYVNEDEFYEMFLDVFYNKVS